MRHALLVTAFALAVLARSAAAQPIPAQDERAVSPYLLLGGSLDLVERGDRYERLGRAAEATGDFARAARHFALACQSRAPQFGGLMKAPVCGRARSLARQHHVLDVEVNLLVSEGTVRAWQLDVPGAVSALNRALTLGASLDPDQPEGAPLTGAHHMLGAILLETGKFDVSLRELGYARDHCGKAGNLTCAAYANIWLCRLHTRVGDYPAARAACDAAQTAVAGDVLVMANLGWMRATLEKALDRHEASLVSLQGAWQAAQLRGAEALKPGLAHAIADALVTVGRLDEAELWQQQIERAAAAGQVAANYGFATAMRRGDIALARGQLDAAITAYAFASGSPQHEVAIGSDLALARARQRRGDHAGARHALERAIAKIETGRTNLTGATLRSSYLNLHATAYRELIGVRWDAEGVAAAPAALELAEAGRARALLDALTSAQVAGAAAPTLDATGVQATLGRDEVLVEYVSSRDRLFAITATRDRVALVPLPNAGTADQLARRIDFFSVLVQESNEAALGAPARRLYADLLAPALANVPASARTLIIAADGPLHRLPFDALSDGRVLLDRWDVVTLPSASALAHRTRREPPTGAALVVSAPASAGLSSLPAAPDEAAAVRRRIGGDVTELSGMSATEERVATPDLGRFAVVHFASHAVVDDSTPLRSALMLAPGGAGADGRWNAEEIYRTPINADLVVLSACSTAAGAPAPGEGVMSLSRAFLYAGAGATIATLWDVPDAPGPVFADALYRGLAAGQPLGAAAAGARRELRRRGAPPRAWAAYVLTGHPGATVAINPRTDLWSVSARIAGGVAAILLLVAAVAFFHRPQAPSRWPVPAAAALAMAILAIALGRWTTWGLSLNGDSPERGTAGMSIDLIVSNGRAAWIPVPAADEHSVVAFDSTGVPAGLPAPTRSPFVVPVSAADGWVRVEARQHGQLIARSALIRIPRTE